MSTIKLNEPIQTASSLSDNELINKVMQMKEKGCYGALEITIRNKKGDVVNVIREPNLVKVFAKELLSHRIPYSMVWNPQLNNSNGASIGGWVPSDIDPTEEFAVKYILIGASFDNSGLPIENDPRYYTLDPVTSTYVPLTLTPGATNNGGLINGVPIAEPSRPLKRIESITFSPTYQPSGIPLLQDDVRAMNNIVRLTTTLQLDEYNGFGVTNSDYFVITEIALAGGKTYDSVGACDLPPDQLFLQGHGTGSAGSGATNSGAPIQCIANGTDTINISSSETDVDLIGVGDQIKIVGPHDAVNQESISQVSPFYLVLAKAIGGRDITLDRVPVNSNNAPIVGNIGAFRSTLRLYSQRILSTPFKKSDVFEIQISWALIFS